MTTNPCNTIRVIIYGSWSNDWMAALGPSSIIWRNHPKVSEVLLADHTNFEQLPPPKNPDSTTICLPLMEWHMIECPRKYPVLISSPEVVRTLAFKHLFIQHMKQIRFDHFCPATYIEFASTTYPAVLKRTDRNGGYSVQFIDSEAQLRDCLAHPTWKNHPVIIQEWVEGNEEFVTHLVCKNGEIFWHSSFSYIHESSAPLKSSNTLIHMNRIQLPEELLNIFKTIINSLKFSGPCSIDFKFNKDGHLKIFEINPRLGGSLMRPENADLLREAIDHILHLAN